MGADHRLTKVTREVGGAPVAIETYGFNALGALSLNAGAAVDDQRPRLAGGGTADAAVAATLGGQPVTLDGGGRVTSLRGVSFTWSFRGYPLSAAAPVPALPETYTVDASLRRVSKVQGSSVEYYVYDGVDRVGVVGAAGEVVESYLFDGVDHPLRMKRGGASVYFELDLAGNVRRLRGDAGIDHGGYRYTAFGKTVTDDAIVVQPLRWKARWWQSLGGSEIYDVRARQWSPELGSFLSIDEYAWHDATTTLWGWPNQNPIRWSDPFGRGSGAEDSRSALNQFLYGLDDSGALDATAGFGTGLLDNIPLFAVPGGPTVGDVASAAGLAGQHPSRAGACSGGGSGGGDDTGDKARALGHLAGALALGAGGAASAARGAQAAARFDPARAGHIFREAAGHVNPASAGSQARFARLFENVASNPANLRADAVQAGLITQQAAEAGVQAFTWTGTSGQVWATLRNGLIQNAGVNPLGALR